MSAMSQSLTPAAQSCMTNQKQCTITVNDRGICVLYTLIVFVRDLKLFICNIESSKKTCTYYATVKSLYLPLVSLVIFVSLSEEFRV